MPGMKVNVDPSELNLDPNKPTILIVSDSAAIHSGFAQVVRNVFKRLWAHREWNIVQYGWWHNQAMETVPWPIITTRRDPHNPNFGDPADKYGEVTFEDVVGSVKPDLVWVMGDPWMLGPTLQNAHSDSYTKMLYIPVDGAPLIYSWDIVEKADVVVPYLPWGRKMIERWHPDAKMVSHIAHGVDTATYKPIDGPIRKAVRRGRCQINDDDILILSVGRNQSRKNLPALVELMYYIRSGDYRVCKSCGKAWRNRWDYQLGKPTGEKADCQDPTCWGGDGPNPPRMLNGEPHENVYLYLHTPIKDLQGHSWRITDLLDCFNLGVLSEDGRELRYPGFRWNQHLQPVHGMDEPDMVNLYNSADIFTLATIGEGFGLPILESMSCGVPVVVPNISSHPDFVGEGGGLLVDIAHHVNEPVSSYYRGYPDMDEYLTHLLLLIEDASLRKTLGKAARETALKYDWDRVAQQWRDLINEHIKFDGSAKLRIKTTAV